MQLKERTSYYFKRHCVGYWKQARMPECSRIKYALHTLQRTSNCRIYVLNNVTRAKSPASLTTGRVSSGACSPRGDPTRAAVATP